MPATEAIINSGIIKSNTKSVPNVTEILGFIGLINFRNIPRSKRETVSLWISSENNTEKVMYLKDYTDINIDNV